MAARAARRERVDQQSFFEMERSVAAAARARFEPKCSVPGCTEDGMHGFNVSLLKGQVGTWFCAPHYRQQEQGRGA